MFHCIANLLNLNSKALVKSDLEKKILMINRLCNNHIQI